jgi:hypothetical protein
MSEVVDQGQTTEPVAAQTSEQADPKETINKSQAELVKTLRELRESEKQTRLKSVELKKQLEEAKQKSMQESGQFKELADIWQRKASDMEALASKRTQAFAASKIADAIALEAAKAGCLDTDSIVSLLPLESIPIDEGFNVDKESVKAMVEDFRKNKPYFFKKDAPRIVTGNPSKEPVVVGKSPDKMSAKELEQYLLEKFKK